jgi:energy-coupling factor transporter ATP-binding protein EcfA2
MPRANNLIGTAPLEQLIETAIFTGHLYDTVPISLMLIGPSGAGKSKLLLKFEGAMLHRSDDVTSSGLQDIMQADEKEQTITHIVLPDFNAPLSHKPATSTLLVANLLTMMSDGTARIDDGREMKTLVHNPIGILTAVTPEMYSKNEYKWKVLGFKRRFLPIFYDYTPATIMRAQSDICKGKITSQPLTKKLISFKDGKKVIKLNKREAEQLKEMSVYLAECLAIHGIKKRDEEKKIKHEIVPGKVLLPYSPHLLLQAMARGNALKHGRSSVIKKDITFCGELLSFCRYGEPKRL